MMWKILRKILKRHLYLHLIIPLSVGLLAHFLHAYFFLGRPWKAIISGLGAVESLVVLVGIFGAYLVIMYHLVKKETAIRVGGTDLAVLNGELSRACRYFATSTIGMKEWFDPISQVFLANIISQKLQRQTFADERVLLFSRRGEMDDLYSPYLDGYYAQRLAEIHLHYGTRIGFLRRPEIFGALGSLSLGERKGLGCYPGWIGWLPHAVLELIPLSWIRPGLPELDFALLEQEDGNRSVLRVFKKGQNVRIQPMVGADVAPYARFVELIKQRVYRSGAVPPCLDESHDFVKMFHPLSGISAGAGAPESRTGQGDHHPRT